MRRLPAFFVTAGLAIILPVSSASAFGVGVENPGMFSITGENTLSIHTILPEALGGTEVTGLKCAQVWEANVDENGHVDVNDVEINAHSGSIGSCNQWNDCDDAGWEGQLEEGHKGTKWEYGVHLTLCLEGTGSAEINGIPFTVECEMPADGDEVHCGGVHDGHHDKGEEESHLFIHQLAPGLFAEFNLEGEGFVSPSLNLIHVQKD